MLGNRQSCLGAAFVHTVKLFSSFPCSVWGPQLAVAIPVNMWKVNLSLSNRLSQNYSSSVAASFKGSVHVCIFIRMVSLPGTDLSASCCLPLQQQPGSSPEAGDLAGGGDQTSFILGQKLRPPGDPWTWTICIVGAERMTGVAKGNLVIGHCIGYRTWAWIPVWMGHWNHAKPLREVSSWVIILWEWRGWQSCPIWPSGSSFRYRSWVPLWTFPAPRHTRAGYS
jgi:hypothetical protein